jgi:hypothetical protein
MWKTDLDAQITAMGLEIPDSSRGRLIH